MSESTELRRHEKSVALNCPVDEGQNLIAIVRRKKNGHQIAIVDRAIREGYSVIRGLHFTEDDPPRRDNHREVPENAPPGGDILNPESVACFIRLVYQRYYDEFKEHFGKTVQAIFTDEPSFLARRGERGAMPGTTDILEHVSSHLGYDFSPCLPAPWYSDEPDVGPNSAWWNDRWRIRSCGVELTGWCQWMSESGLQSTICGYGTFSKTEQTFTSSSTKARIILKWNWKHPPKADVSCSIRRLPGSKFFYLKPPCFSSRMSCES